VVDVRKKWIAATVTTSLVLGMTGAAWAWSGHEQIGVVYRNIQMYVDNTPVPAEDEPFIHAEKGRTFVPARPLAEALGATVSWDEARSAVIVQTPGYVEQEAIPQAEAVRWSLPAAGVAIQVHQSYQLDTRRGERLGLTAVDPAGEVRASIRNLDRPTTVPLKERTHDVTEDLLEDIGAELTGYTRDGSVIDGDHGDAEIEYRVSGFAKLGDGTGYRFAVRVIETPVETWVVAAYGPESWGADGTVESFTY